MTSYYCGFVYFVFRGFSRERVGVNVYARQIGGEGGEGGVEGENSWGKQEVWGVREGIEEEEVRIGWEGER